MGEGKNKNHFMIHELKTWPEYFRLITSGEKTFEVRKLDRFFNVGDTLLLQEWSPVQWQDNGGYSGNEIEKKVTYVMNGGKWGIPEGICIMGLTDEQPIPVNQDENELWKEVINKVESSEFRKERFIDTISTLKSKYSIQLKSSPSPTPVKNDKKIIREFAFEIALRLTDTLDTVDCSSFSSVAKAVEKTLRQTIFTIDKDPTKTYEPIPDEQPPTPVQEGLREDENEK